VSPLTTCARHLVGERLHGRDEVDLRGTANWFYVAEIGDVVGAKGCAGLAGHELPSAWPTATLICESPSPARTGAAMPISLAG